MAHVQFALVHAEAMLLQCMLGDVQQHNSCAAPSRACSSVVWCAMHSQYGLLVLVSVDLLIVYNGRVTL
jgi:hypothetical protein